LNRDTTFLDRTAASAKRGTTAARRWRVKSMACFVSVTTTAGIRAL
jgi:hypothetical protein